MPVDTRRVYVSLGTNIQREENIRRALAALTDRFSRLQCSSVYQSDAVGFDGPPFYNMVIAFDSDELPRTLVRFFKQVEKAQGRGQNSGGMASRTLDLDLLLYGREVISEPDFELPRDEILKYAFVLKPLAEIAGDTLHPMLAKSYRELWDEFDRQGQELKIVEVPGLPAECPGARQ